MATPQQFMEAGTSAPLASEISRQINVQVGDARRLAGWGMPYPLATTVADAINGTGGLGYETLMGLGVPLALAQALSASEGAGQVTVTLPAIPEGVEDAVYAGFTPTVAGGATPYAFAGVGTFPAGLTVNASTGAVAGTPTAAGTSSGLRIQVTTATGAVALSAAFAIVITAAP